MFKTLTAFILLAPVSAFALTPAQIDAQFDANIRANFHANRQLDATLNQMGASDLAFIAMRTNGDPQILAEALPKVSSANLLRLVTAFGADAQRSEIQGVTAAPMLDYTFYEIYLDYLTAGNSVGASLWLAGQYITLNLGAAYVAGNLLGQAIDWTVGQIYGPTWDDAIGGTEAIILGNAQDAIDAWLNGEEYDTGL